MKTFSLWPKIILAVVFASTLEAMGPSPSAGAKQTPPAVVAVMDDAMVYQIPLGVMGDRGRPNRHRLHPGPHSLAVGQFVERTMDADELGLPDESAVWCRTFTERDKYLMSVAAYYHDVGKFGGDPSACAFQSDGKIAFSLRPGHELIGFYYALAGILDDEALRAVGQRLCDVHHIDCAHLHEYILLSDQHMKNIFDWAGLTVDEQRLVAVLIGSHRVFTQVCMNAPGFSGLLNVTNTLKPDEFVAFLRDLCAMAGLQTGVDAKLVDMVITLTLADVHAVFFCPEPFVPSRVVGSEYAALLRPRRNSLHGTDVLDGKPCDERVFQTRFYDLFVDAAHAYRDVIFGLL